MPEANQDFDLELDKVSKAYEDNVVVNDVSLSMKKGEFVALLGPSGCGKTTTLSMIAGFEIPTSGAIKIRGERVDTRPPERRNIGMVFQNYALFPHMTVAENIGFGLRMRGTSRREIAARVTECAKLVKVDHLLARLPRQLSGGQQQRVALARALIVQPAILLLDEPFGALDRLLREELQIEVRALLKRLDITTVFVTHDQDEALSMSDRVAVMSAGNIEQIDTPHALYDMPQTEMVAAFIGKASIVQGQVRTNEFGSPDGGFTLPASMQGQSDGTASYFLRPEAISIVKNPGTFDCEVAGAVVGNTFFGDRQMLSIKSAGGQSYLATAERSKTFEPGQAIRIGWSSSSASIFQNGRRR